MSIDLVPYDLTTTKRAERAARRRESVATPVLPAPVADGGAKSLAPQSIEGPSPCDGCPSAERCEALLMCCRAFVAFAEGRGRWQSVARLPSRRRYVALYGDAPADASLDDERAHVVATLAGGGDVPAAAALLGLRVNALYKRLHRWGIAREGGGRNHG